MGSDALQPDWRAMLTDQVLSEFETDGVIFLPQALHPEWLMLIELGMMRVMDNTAQTKHRFFQGQPGEFIETVRNFDVTPEIQRLLYDSPIADMLGKVIGSDNVWLYSEEFFIKEGGNCARTPWHQDMPYWPLEGSQLASMWITLDTLPRAETLEFVRGSHRQTRYDGFDPGAVNGLGILLGDKKPGPFELEVDWIKVIKTS